MTPTASPPIPLSLEDRTRFHGVNERVSVEAYERAILFYEALLRGAAGPETPLEAASQ